MRSVADPSLLGSSTSLSAGSALSCNFRILPAIKFREKRFNVTCAAASPPPSLGRRVLMSITATSFLVPFPTSASTTDKNPLLQEEIMKVLTKGKAPGLLRLVFHDAGTFDENEKTGGMNGSIVYELDRPENTGLEKSLKVLRKVKDQVDAVQPVSWADLIAMAGAQSVLVCGGPEIPVQLGRIDATVPDPEGKLPQESLDAHTMKKLFQKKGFSVQELVALSGAHTLGSKGFGKPTVFDNSYYKVLLEKPWSSTGGMSAMIGLPSDRALVEDSECMGWISKYAKDENLFFQDFKKAYVKLVNSGANWRSSA